MGMLERKTARWVGAGALGLGLLLPAALVLAQQVPNSTPPAPPKNPDRVGVLHLTTNLGSFKILSPGDVDAEGTVDMSFKGTVLISGIDGTVTPSATLTREYYDTKHNKQTFFGTGHLLIAGKFRSIEWLGQDLNAVYTGRGIVRLYGDFDKNLNTGFYWFGNDTANKAYWSNFGTEVVNPPYIPKTIVPEEKPGKG